MKVVFRSAQQSCPNGPNPVCNLLYLDKLSFLVNQPARLLENKQSAWKIYPNPAGERLYVQGLFSGDKVRLYDSSGRLISSDHSNGTIDLSKLSAGLYFLILENKNGTGVFSTKVFKE